MKEKSLNIYRYTLKTPVHVGSGEKLSKLDVILDKNQCIVIDIESLLEKLEDNQKALNEFAGRNFNISNFLKDYKIPSASVLKYSIKNPDKIKSSHINIQEFIKTGMGNPIIPGSSIKGALRTVLFWHLIKTTDKSQTKRILYDTLNPKIKNKRASGDLSRNFFGPNPNYDFFRGLQVGDVEFQISDMGLIESKVLNMTNNDGFGWKKMGHHGFTDPNHHKATPIFCEALDEGSFANGRLKIDNFLFENPVCIKELGFSDKKDLINDFPKRCNEFASVFIESEIEFFEKINMKEMVEFYKNLKNDIPMNEQGFLLHLGWGTGWKSMTGNWLDEETLLKFRECFNLGKSICLKCDNETKPDKNRKGYFYCFYCKKSSQPEMYPTFPKSRKIAFNRGIPFSPFGWIQVEKLTQIKTRLNGSEKNERMEILTKSEFKKNYEEFRLRPSPDNFRSFIEKIKDEDIPELKDLSLKTMKDSINIGFASPLLECNISEDIKNILAGKLLEVLKPGKKWNKDKIEKYNKLKNKTK